MSAIILAFPGVPLPRQHSDSLSDLEPGRKALVVSQQKDGQFAVRLGPAVTEQDRRVEMLFATAPEARAYARRSQAMWPLLYQKVVEVF